MNEKYLLPLIGVVLGWLLTTIASGYKERINKKRLIGVLITKLIRVEQQVNTQILATENLKHISDGWTNYERVRKGVVNRHFLEPENVRKDFKNSIDAISPIYPILAIELEDIYQVLLKHKSMSLHSSSKVETAYIQMLSIYEVGLDITQKRIKSIIKKLAFKHSFSTYLKLKYKDYSKAKNIKQNEDFILTMIKEMQKELKKSKKL